MTRSWRRVAVLFALMSSAAFASWPLPPTAPPADYTNPSNWPSDPAFAQSYWELSFTPTGVPLVAAEAPYGTGVSLDRAWSVTRGHPSILIAVIGGGVQLGDPDLVNRWALSRAELPAPQDANGMTAPGQDPHDRNGDGRFNIQDFTSVTGAALPVISTVVDPRLTSRPDKGDANGNGLLDPEDLLAAFADGIDQDANGNTDDVCGFDYGFGDADPEGNDGALAAILAAQANNGVGGVGACPECSILPVKVSSTEVADPMEVATALYRAVNAGARVIIVGAQTFGTHPALEYAIRVAKLFGAVVIGSGAPRPGMREDAVDLSGMIRADALGPDSASWQAATRVFALSSCAGVGTMNGVGVAAPSCGGDSAAVLGGSAALVLSRAKELGVALSGDEAVALLMGTATPAPTPDGHPRIDVRAALDALEQGRRPTTLEVSAPAHVSAAFEVNAVVGAPSRVQLEVGSGFPAASFTQVATRSVTAEDALGPVDPRLFATSSPEPSGSTYSTALTVRVRAEAELLDGGFGPATTAERVVYVDRELDLFTGFPVRVADGGLQSVRLVDLDGDGSDELVYSTTNAQLGALSAEGTSLPGFPVQPALATLYAPPAIGDLDGDGTRELIAAFTDGWVAAYTSAGAPLSGFPLKLGHARCLDDAGCAPPGMIAAPVIMKTPAGNRLVLADLNGLVHVLRPNGEEINGSPFSLEDAAIAATPATGDLDGDGWPELVVGTAGPSADAGTAARVWLLHVQNDALAADPAWSVTIGTSEGAGEALYRRGLAASPLLANLDRSGAREIVVQPAGEPIRVLRADGVELLQLSDARGQAVPVSPAIGDFDSDGLWEIVTAERGDPSPYLLRSWNAGARLRANQGKPSLSQATEPFSFPVALDDAPVLSGFAVADVSGDGSPEILFGTQGPLLHAVSRDGTEPPGWPKVVPGGVAGNVSVGVMSNGLVVAAASRFGEIYVWRVQGFPGQIIWDGFHHDPENTGDTATPLPERHVKAIGIENPPPPERGCCAGAPGQIDAVALLAVAAALRSAWRRRAARG